MKYGYFDDQNQEYVITRKLQGAEYVVYVQCTGNPVMTVDGVAV